MERNTVQRQIVMAAIQKMDTHPAIEEVYAEIKKEYPTVSKTTVYRNLRQLAKEGIIRQVSLPDDVERYDRSVTQHHHFKCQKCNVIFDVEIEYPEDINGSVVEKYGFEVDRHEVVFTGVCLKCKKIKKKQ